MGRGVPAEPEPYFAGAAGVSPAPGVGSVGEFDAAAVLDLGSVLAPEVDVEAGAGVGVLEHEPRQVAEVQVEAVAGGAVAVEVAAPVGEGLKAAAELGPVAGVVGENGCVENAVVHGSALSHGLLALPATPPDVVVGGAAKNYYVKERMDFLACSLRSGFRCQSKS